MKEYIDKEELLKRNMYGNSNSIIHRTYVEELVKSLEAADVKEVVHAKWIDTSPDYHYGFGNNAHKCSVCGDYYTTEPGDLFFCPRCGAIMDLE